MEKAPRGTRCFVVFCTEEPLVSTKAADPASSPTTWMLMSACVCPCAWHVPNPMPGCTGVGWGGLGSCRDPQYSQREADGTPCTRKPSVSRPLSAHRLRKWLSPHFVLLAFPIHRAAATDPFHVLKSIPSTTGPLHTLPPLGWHTLLPQLRPQKRAATH